MKPLRFASWLGSVALVVLGARALAYAVAPSPLARELEGRAGGPALPLVVLVSLVLGVAFAAAVVWLAAIGVAERRLLETRPVVFEPRLRLRRLVVRALALWLATMPIFALVESYIHWRQGLGWHGLHCLTGPVHRNAIPILGALSLVAAAVRSALEHVVTWMRRTLARLAETPLAVAAVEAVAPFAAAVVARAAARLARPRAPPAFA